MYTSPTYYRLLTVSLLLMICSLISGACLQPVETVPGLITPVPTVTEEIDPGAVYWPPVSPTSTPQRGPTSCAVVIAETALHVRESPDENSKIIGTLVHGERVQVFGKVDSGWWVVVSSKYVGYARSKYLEERTC